MNPSPVSTPVFMWGPQSGHDFTNALDDTYSEVVHWKKNSFDIPFGKSGYEFASKVSRLFSAFANASSVEHRALKATVAITFCSYRSHTIHLKLKIMPGVLITE